MEPRLNDLRRERGYGAGDGDHALVRRVQYAVGRDADVGVARRCSRAAASIQRAGAPPAAMLGMGAVLLDSTEMLVVGDLLVLVHGEGALMPRGGRGEQFYALLAPHCASFRPFIRLRMVIFEDESSKSTPAGS